MSSPTGVDEYLAALPEERRAAPGKLRNTIRAAAPEATETISYGMPTFKQDGTRPLASLADRAIGAEGVDREQGNSEAR